MIVIENSGPLRMKQFQFKWFPHFNRHPRLIVTGCGAQCRTLDMMWFQGVGYEADRMLPAHFGENFHAAGADFNNVVLFLVLTLLVICACLGLPGSGYAQRAKAFLILIVGFYFGASILITQFSHEWETAEVETELTLHSAHHSDGSNHSIAKSTVKLHLGLRGINVSFTNVAEGFHFNEKFDWAWAQGRDGFGPLAGSFQRQFRQGQRSGFPAPILWVADLFTHDGEGIRYGRMYRYAGWHIHSILWSAFVFWIMAVISAQFSIVPAANFLALSGAMLLLANIVWAALSPALKARPPVVLLGSAALKLHLGPAFYLCLVTGLLALLLAGFLILFNGCFPIQAAEFFGLDPGVIYEECYCSAQEARDYFDQETKKRSSALAAGIRRSLNRISYKSNDQELTNLMQHSPIPAPRSQHNSSDKDQVLLLRRRDSGLMAIGHQMSHVRPLTSSRLEGIPE